MRRYRSAAELKHSSRVSDAGLRRTCEGSACRESLRRGRTHQAATLQPPVQGGTVAALAFCPVDAVPNEGTPTGSVGSQDGRRYRQDRPCGRVRLSSDAVGYWAGHDTARRPHRSRSAVRRRCRPRGTGVGLLDRRHVDRRCSMVRLEENSVRHITSHVTHSEGSQARTCPLRPAADPQPERSTPAHDIPTRRRGRCSPAPPASLNMAGETTPDDHASSPSAVPRRRRWRPSSQQTPFGVRELPRTTSSSSSST